jgi:CobQ-like glutamine amidotransferase family enzyme/UDP-N-acetylmuramyl tripeptide synthase
MPPPGSSEARTDQPAASAPAARRARGALALGATRVAGGLSRLLRLGSGSVVGGRIGLAIDPELVELLTAGRSVAVVSGTNGKTTTTRFLAEALRLDPSAVAEGRRGTVAWSAAGANMPAGIVAALAGAPPHAPAVLEVDEAYLPSVLRSARPAAAVLLNLSRDQLDRVSEVRMLASRWATALCSYPGAVVANADDPLVVWAARQSPGVRFVGAGQLWRSDARHCPACDAGIELERAGEEHTPWRCSSCHLARPSTVAELTAEGLLLDSGEDLRFDLAVPGRFNRANAAMAAVAASAMGVPLRSALDAIAGVSEVAGRFATVAAGSALACLMLAKNPAGWTELVELLAGGSAPLVAAINARLADGHDPSWLWDVPFERLAGRPVVATGERRLDLAVRLLHAGVAHELNGDPLLAIARAERAAEDGGRCGETVDVVGNYTAFQELRRRTVPRGPSLPSGGGTGADYAGPGAGAAQPALAGVAPPPGRRVRVGVATGAGWPPARPVVRAVPAGETSRRRGAPGASALRIVVVHPDLLGTYGDGGNGRVLANRALWRELAVELVLAESDQPLPLSADCYCLGGGEDGPQFRSAELLRAGSLATAVAAGATVLAVCAGFQIAGSSFPGPGGSTVAGLGLLDVTTTRPSRPRAVGEVLARALGPERVIACGELLTGFENHASTTTVGPGATALAEVVRGTGNDGGGSEGAVAGRVVGTYLHGPVLARNPALADGLLALATGRCLAPLEDDEETALSSERVRACGGSRFALRRR